MRVGVYGAGAVGGYLGVALSAAGVPVTLVGRRWLFEARGALVAVPLRGAPLRPGPDLVVSEEPEALRGVDVCLVCVKSRDTRDAGRVLAAVLPEGCAVVSFQNGIENAEVLGEFLDGAIPGMIGFNVRIDGARFLQATSGLLCVAAGAAGESLRGAFARVGVDLRLRDDMRRVLAGKLLINLGNGICAATGLGTAAMIRDGDARRCFSLCIREGLRVMRGAGLRPVSVVGLPPAVVARVLALPDGVVRLLAPLIVKVDGDARASTLMDLDRGRPTEIDALNGAIAKLAGQAGSIAPVNERIVQIVHGLEADLARGAMPGFVRPAALRHELALLC